MLKSKLKIKGSLEEDFQKELRKAFNAVKEATPVDTGKARDGWRLQGTKIINDVDYIEELNGGSSKQAPKHFIEKTVLSLGYKVKGTIVKTLS